MSKDDKLTPIPGGEDDFGPDIITLTDEAGVEHTFELADVLEHKGQTYVALLVVADSPEQLLEDDGNLVVMKITEEGDEEILELIEDDDEFEQISEMFVERLSDLYEFEDYDDQD